MAVKIKGWHIVAIMLLLFLAWQYGFFKITVTPPLQPEPPAQQLVAVNKPLRIVVTDPLAGSAIPSASVQIFGADKVMRESLTTWTDGIVNTAMPYASDTTLHVRIAKSGYVTRWVTLVVPKMAPADAESLATNFVALSTVQLGSYVIRAVDQFGNTYTSGARLNFTSLGTTTVTVTFTVYNTRDNSGYITSYDVLNDLSLGAVFQTRTDGTAVTVTGAGASVQRGTTTFWHTPLQDDTLTRQLVGAVYTKPGVTSVSITFGRGALAPGAQQSFTYSLLLYFDQSYFAAQGVGGPDATTAATFTLLIAR